MSAKKKAKRRTFLLHGKTWELEDDVGRVYVEGDEASMDLISVAVRMGFANPSPEAAEAIYPALDLAPGEEPANPGEVVGGVPVFCWIPPRMAAELVQVTPRTVRNWEGAGLPSRGHHNAKRYPLPHFVVWAAAYHVEVARLRRCDHLPFAVALAIHRLGEAKSEAGYRD